MRAKFPIFACIKLLKENSDVDMKVIEEHMMKKGHTDSKFHRLEG